MGCTFKNGIFQNERFIHEITYCVGGCLFIFADIQELGHIQLIIH